MGCCGSHPPSAELDRIQGGDLESRHRHALASKGPAEVRRIEAFCNLPARPIAVHPEEEAGCRFAQSARPTLCRLAPGRDEPARVRQARASESSTPAESSAEGAARAGEEPRGSPVNNLPESPPCAPGIAGARPSDGLPAPRDLQDRHPAQQHRQRRSKRWREIKQTSKPGPGAGGGGVAARPRDGAYAALSAFTLPGSARPRRRGSSSSAASSFAELSTASPPTRSLRPRAARSRSPGSRCSVPCEALLHAAGDLPGRDAHLHNRPRRSLGGCILCFFFIDI